MKGLVRRKMHTLTPKIIVFVPTQIKQERIECGIFFCNFEVLRPRKVSFLPLNIYRERLLKTFSNSYSHF